MTNTATVLQTLRTERQKINAMITNIKETLARIEKGELSPDQPFVSLRRVKDIKGLLGTHRNLKEALFADLAMLRRQLKQVKMEQRMAHSHHLRQRVSRAKSTLDKYIDDIVRDNEIDAAELEEFQKKADNLLALQTLQLKGNPCPANIKGVLDTLSTSQLLGAESNSGASDTALKALSTATEVRYAKAKKQFRKNPTSSNLHKMYEEEALSQLLSGDIDRNDSDFAAVGNVRHVIAKGETLSGLSEKYYGSYIHWDVIYERNAGQIGDLYDSLPIGMTIVIP